MSGSNQSEVAYQYLRKKLFNRELAGGARVRYGPLGKEIGMSATPIREAIGRLANEGLVDLVPQSGAVVKRPTREDAAEVYEMREAIEPFAAAKASQLISLRQIKTLQSTLASMREIQQLAARTGTIQKHQTAIFDQADLRFHLIILEAAQNRRMFKAVSDFHLLTGIIGADRHNYEIEVLELTLEDHTGILNTLRDRDSEGARQAMLIHIRNSRQLTMSLLSQSPAFPVFQLSD